jgi:hypothetical protein
MEKSSQFFLGNFFLKKGSLFFPKKCFQFFFSGIFFRFFREKGFRFFGKIVDFLGKKIRDLFRKKSNVGNGISSLYPSNGISKSRKFN